MTEILKPCPFCGSNHVGDSGLWRHVITCHDCGANSKPCSNWADAVQLWNNRTLSPKKLCAEEMFSILVDILVQLRLATLGFKQAKIDAIAIESLINSIYELENKNDLQN